MTIPTQGQGSFAVNVEHTRDVHYVIEMTKTETTFVDAKNLITKLIVLPVLEGVLAAGTDDIPNATPDMVFDANTDSITVDVQLDDSTLNTGRPTDRYIWQRTFTFEAPGVQEP